MFGATGVALVAAACSGGGSTTPPRRRRSRRAPRHVGLVERDRHDRHDQRLASGTTTVDCVLTPEMTEGPYYLDDQVIRRDVTEGKAGIPLRLELTVADATKCTTVPGLMVEIWHADAEGNYSGFGSGGSTTTFLRGGQNADADGKVVFQTIYPGWYRGAPCTST